MAVVFGLGGCDKSHLFEVLECPFLQMASVPVSNEVRYLSDLLTRYTSPRLCSDGLCASVQQCTQVILCLVHYYG